MFSCSLYAGIITSTFKIFHLTFSSQKVYLNFNIGLFMNVKYPIELELSSFCSLKCISCINSSIKSKTNISIENFDLILDYVFKNKDNILYINLS